MRRALARVVAVVGLLGTATVLAAGTAAAHPLGNFSVNTYSGVVVTASAVRVDVVVDRAEIPTRQVFPTLDDSTGTLPGRQAIDAAVEQCATTAASGELLVDGRPVVLAVERAALTFPEGAAGLRTARLVCRMSTGQLEDLVGSRVAYALTPPAGAAGWNEVTVSGDGAAVTDSDVPAVSPSDGLRAYPDDLLSSPLDVRSASFTVSAGSGTASAVTDLLGQGPLGVLPRGADRVTEAFTGLVSRDDLDAVFVGGALLLSVVLGGAHAFAPGHGKTVMAAYLIGRRGGVRDAVLIGASVTVTHTLGVVTLGLGLTALGLASSERLYSWLTLGSGLLLVAIGSALLRAARRRPRPPAPHPAARQLVGAGPGLLPHEPHRDGGDGHRHDHDHDHDHDPGQPHSHGLFSHSHPLPAEGRGLRGLVAVGFAGGMVPSPSALVVLLGGIALGRAWFGLLLVVAYGVGMAVSLAATGVLLARGRDRLVGSLATGSAGRAGAVVARVASVLPVLTAGAVAVIGAGIAARAATGLV